jgi:hypothetical protein
VDGNFDVVLDWAMGDYRWRDELGFRFGKIKRPTGLYNEYRDADMARPTILLPQALYSEAVRDLAATVSGVALYGDVVLGRGGSLRYQAWGGTDDIDNAPVIARFLETGAWAAANFLPMELDNLSVSLSNVRATIDHMYGLSLDWHTPVDGLRVVTTFYTAESEFSATANYSGWMDQIPAAFAIQLHTFQDDTHSCVGALEYTRGDLLIAAEYQRTGRVQENSFSGLPFPLPPIPAVETESEAYYGLVAYRFTPWLQTSTYYAESYPNRDDKDGASYVMRGQPDYLAWNKDLALALRFDITTGWLVKLEYHAMDGVANVPSLWNEDGFEKDWSVFLARATFHF